MRKMITVIVVVCLIFGSLYYQPVKAATRYVRTTGSNAGGNTCLNLATPCRTITYAIGQAVSGDTVDVGAGTYSTAAPAETFPIAIGKNLILHGAGSVTTIIDRVTHGSNAINVSGNFSVDINGFTIRHGTVGISYATTAHGTVSNNVIWSNDDDGINFNYPSYGTISFNTVYENGNDGIDVNDTTTYNTNAITVNANTVYNNVGNGIELYYCTNTVVVTNNVIYNTSGQDHGIENDFADVVIINNTIVGHNGTSRSGIDNDNDSDTVVTNNIITGNTYGIRCVDGASSSVNTYNDVWSNTTNYSGTAAGAGSISSDPRYTGGTNYHLTCSPLSPAIDTGTSTGAPAADRDGTARPQGPSVDMGAYETTCATYTVTANANGNGTGNVASNVGGINYNYPATNTWTTSSLAFGTNVILTATAGTGSTASWNDCVAAGGTAAGNGTATATCTFSSLNGNKTVTATFTLNTYTVTANANVAGTGSGTVTSDVGGINFTYPANNTGTTSALNYGSNIVLTATAGLGSLASWTDCTSQGGTVAGNGTSTATCTYNNLTSSMTFSVTFTLRTFTVTANANGTGTGTVTSDVGGISYTYPANNTGTTSALNFGSNIVLTATAGTGSNASWTDCVFYGGTVSGNGTATATCTYIYLTSNETFSVTFALNTYTVTANANGNGTGNVASNVGGINYNYPANNTGTTSTLNYGTNVVLTATVGIGSTASWNDCVAAGGTVAGNGTATATCTFSSLDGAKTVAATFTLKTYTVTANANGNGTGNVASNVGGINYNYPANNTGTSSAINFGTNVVLTATAGTGSTAAWNDCVAAGGTVAGNGTATATCTFSSLNGNKTVTATFTLNQYALIVTIVGNGTVTSNPAGINCGSDCVEVYNYGTIVTLTATPTAISSFTGWSGACSGTALTCTLTIDAAKNVTATFGLKQANKKVQLPSLLPMALNNMASAKTLLTQANELLSQAKEKGKDTGTCENLIREATELLAKANTVRTNPVYANNLALQSIAKLKQAIDCLKALAG